MKNLLLVDDELELAHTIATVIGQKGYNVVVCGSAKEGLEKIQEIEFDCIVSDMSMPEMNGVEFLKGIRKMNFDTPFIIFTGFASDDLAFEVAQYGCFDFIEKPKMAGLHEAIKRAMEVKSHESHQEIDVEELSNLIDKMDKE